MPLDKSRDHYFIPQGDTEKEKRIQDIHARYMLACASINYFFQAGKSTNTLGDYSLDEIIADCYAMSEDYWNHPDTATRAVRRMNIKQHISARIKMYIDSKGD